MNAHYRKHGTMQGFPGLSPDAAARMDADIVASPAFAQTPYPSYELSSLREKIKRARARLEELDRLEAARSDAAKDDTVFSLDGCTGRLVENPDLCRLQILFDVIPGPDLRARLKAAGFRWSPKNSAWQRQLTPNAIREARRILGL